MKTKKQKLSKLEKWLDYKKEVEKLTTKELCELSMEAFGGTFPIFSKDDAIYEEMLNRLGYKYEEEEI